LTCTAFYNCFNSILQNYKKYFNKVDFNRFKVDFKISSRFSLLDLFTHCAPVMYILSQLHSTRKIIGHENRKTLSRTSIDENL